MTEQEQAGEPTPEAKALHGTKAQVEQHEQPETVALDSDTQISTEPPSPDDTKHIDSDR